MTKLQRNKLDKSTTILTEYIAEDSIGKEIDEARNILLAIEEEKKCGTWHTRKYSLIKE